MFWDNHQIIYGEKIGFIGLGKLGMPCAEAIRKKGFHVAGYDVAEKRSDLIEMRESIEDLCRDRDIVFVATPTPHEEGYDGREPSSHKEVKDFNYDSLKKVFKENKDNIACVILEPMNVAYPEDNFLEKVKEITHQNNALLIFDEMITGFRFALGGASEYFGVTPDLATFGKAMANGYPISAICGKKEYMRMFEDVFFSSTFGGELTSIAASIATITKIQKHNIIENLTDKGKKIIKGVQEIIDKYDLQNYFSITGHPSWSFLNFKPNNTYSDYDIKTLFLQEIFQNGIITLGTHNLMLAHSDNDIDNLLLAYAKLLPKIADIVKNKEVDKYLKCHPLIPLFKIR